MGKSSCGNCGNCNKCIKIKVKREKSKGVNLVVVPNTSVTNTNTTLLQLANGNFTFNNMKDESCNPCSPCGPSVLFNPNIFCVRCPGVYNVTAKVILDTIPDTFNITLVMDINGYQATYDIISGSSLSLTLANNFNLCKGDKIQFRIFSNNASYTGNYIAGNISLVKVARFINC